MKGAVAVNVTDGENVVDIRNRIHVIRGAQVMLDRDLAALYQVEVKQLNRQVQRNIERFPADFMFQLNKEECSRCQIGTLKVRRGSNVKYLPYAFTEHGICMLSGVLRSSRAIEVNIAIMRAFVAMRRYLISHGQMLQQIDEIRRRQIADQLNNDERFDTVFTALANGNLLPSGILSAGTEFDALRLVTRIVESAKKEIVVIDPYSDAMTLEVLAKKRPGVKVRLVCKDRGEPTSAEITKFNRQYKNLTVTHSDIFHDRFILVDGAELHNLGSSINCLGRRVTSYSTRDKKEIEKLLAQLPIG